MVAAPRGTAMPPYTLGRTRSIDFAITLDRTPRVQHFVIGGNDEIQTSAISIAVACAHDPRVEHAPTSLGLVKEGESNRLP